MRGTIAVRYDSVNSSLLVPLHSGKLFNIDMEIREIRRKNLLHLTEQIGSFEKLAKVVETSPSVFSQIKTGARNMGHTLARKIELKLRKPVGWMDAQHKDNVAEEPLALYSVSAPLQSRILQVFDWLTPAQQEHALKELEATAQANQSTAKIFGRRLTTADDKSVESAYKKPLSHK